MLMPQNQSILDDRDFQRQKERLENKARRLGLRIASLRRQKPSTDVCRKVEETQRAFTDVEMAMCQLQARYARERDRRGKCKIPSDRCPIAPFVAHSCHHRFP